MKRTVVSLLAAFVLAGCGAAPVAGPVEALSGTGAIAHAAPDRGPVLLVHGHHGQGEPEAQAPARHLKAEVGTQQVERPVREVYEAQQAEHDGQADRQQVGGHVLRLLYARLATEHVPHHHLQVAGAVAQRHVGQLERTRGHGLLALATLVHQQVDGGR